MHFSALYLILLFALIGMFAMGNAEKRTRRDAQADAAITRRDAGIARRDENGFYLARASINGRKMELLVDTGARLVALTGDDARMLGYDPDILPRDVTLITAGGEIGGSLVRLDEIAIGEISVRNVEAVIIDGALTRSLLGLSFLGRVSGMEITRESIIMRQ